MGFQLFQVDAFADKPFSGNSAGVCILTEPVDDAWMQNLAMEMNLAETAFLLKTKEGYNLRWFTPVAEVELCGHATLASAHVLWESGHLKPDQDAYFSTLSGTLSAHKTNRSIELNFPAEVATKSECPDALSKAISAKIGYVGKNRFDYLIVLESEDAVRKLKPDLHLLQEVPSRGIIVTARADSGEFDFVSRFFAPLVGVDEDPVTGSAHCCLAPYWAGVLGKSELVGYQASARGGTVRTRIEGNRVILGGQAFTIFSGEIAKAALPAVHLSPA